MTSPIYVIGHRNPDADSICAAVAGAAFFRSRDGLNTVPARAGDLRPEAAFILNRYGIEPPMLLTDLHLRVGDVMTSPAITVRVDEPLADAGRRLQQRGVLALPVVDDAGRFVGLVTTADFAELFFRGLDPSQVDRVTLDLDNIVKVLDGRVLVAAPERRLNGRIRVGAMAVDSMRQRLTPNILVVMGDREDGQIAAIEVGVGALVITGGHPVSDKVIDLARQRRVTIISVPHHTYATVRLLMMSAPVREFVRTDVPTCSPDDQIDAARERLRAVRTLPVVDVDRRVIGVVTRSDLLRPVRRQVILVDHNERGQVVDGVDEAEVIAVVDHHRVADFQTRMPPFVRIEPVGSTNTILARLYRESGITIPRPIAGVMLAGILADTLGFRSPTTTEVDRCVAAELAPLAGEDVESLTREILAAASNVADRSPEELVMQDFKEFTVGGLRFGIGVVETTNSSLVLERQTALIAAMERLRRQGFASVLLAIIDIERSATDLLVAGHLDEVANAFGVVPTSDERIQLSGIVSRKKQIVPLLNRIHDAIVEP